MKYAVRCYDGMNGDWIWGNHIIEGATEDEVREKAHAAAIKMEQDCGAPEENGSYILKPIVDNAPNAVEGDFFEFANKWSR